MAASDLTDAGGPSVTDIVRQTIRRLPRDTKRGMAVLLVTWAALLALHVWDSQDQPGARGIAELASGILGTAGLLLFGLTDVLRRAEEPEVPLALLPGLRADAVTARETPALRQILLALPTLGMLAGALLAAAVALLVLRVWLGTSPIILAVAAVYGLALAAAARTVGRAARRLYDYGQRESGRLARAEAQLSAARFAALQAQMNPHFLFNALNTVASLVRTDPRAAETTIENLSEVLRTTLQRTEGTSGTVREEIDFVRAYLAVESQRFGSRLAVDWRVDPAALDVSLPPLMLQPLVENALKHGISHRREGGRIAIAVTLESGRLRIEVADDGEGFPDSVAEGTGLGNLRKRLEVIYGPAASLSVTSSSRGARVALDLPITAGESRHARADR
jgi:two-component system sensor histidine kinase AlgZ